MPESALGQLPFRIDFDAATGGLVVAMTYGVPPQQTERRKAIPSLEALVVATAEHRHEAFLQTRLAEHLAAAAIQHSVRITPGRTPR
ncbi:hypothetical protein [Streptomyces sp. NPDC003077]|uniref:hypothetical protein n=1 Tax=Streptomyces sp. NPDC003077 TaxID=3154443 RepID=UPI0033B0362E